MSTLVSHAPREAFPLRLDHANPRSEEEFEGAWLLASEERPELTMLRQTYPRLLTIRDRRALDRALRERPLPDVAVVDFDWPHRAAMDCVRALRTASPTMQVILFGHQIAQSDVVSAVNEWHVARLVPHAHVASRLATVVRDVVVEVERERAIRERAQRRLAELNAAWISTLVDVMAEAKPAVHGRALRLLRHAADLEREAGLVHSPSLAWAVQLWAINELRTVSPPGMPAGGIGPFGDAVSPTGAAPARASSLLPDSSSLADVRDILRELERPDPLRPASTAASILRIVLAFDDLINDGLTSEDALCVMRDRRAQYAAPLLEHFAKIRGPRGAEGVVHETTLDHVELGMTFAEDVFAENGLLLIARGQRVTPSVMERLSGQWDRVFTSQYRVRVVPA